MTENKKVKTSVDGFYLTTTRSWLTTGGLFPVVKDTGGTYYERYNSDFYKVDEQPENFIYHLKHKYLLFSIYLLAATFEANRLRKAMNKFDDVAITEWLIDMFLMDCIKMEPHITKQLKHIKNSKGGQYYPEAQRSAKEFRRVLRRIHKHLHCKKHSRTRRNK